MRILPAYYGCLALSLWLCHTITSRYDYLPFTQYLPVTRENLLAHVFLVHNWNPAWMYKINGVLWSIAVEVQLYVLFPLLALSLRWVGRIETLILTLGLALALLWFWPPANKLYVWYLPLFVAGMAGAHLAHRPNLRTGNQPGVASFLLVSAALATLYACWVRAPIPARDLGAGLAVAALCYLWVVRPGGFFFELLSARGLVWIGTFSYSLYLMHHPALQFLYSVRPGWAQGPERLFGYLLLAGIPGSILIAWVFFLGFELPFLRRRPAYAAETDEPLPTRLPLRPAGPITWQALESGL
jgi:peptidoglycan/LPS O-acetylase OafA/YrhL